MYGDMIGMNHPRANQRLRISQVSWLAELCGLCLSYLNSQQNPIGSCANFPLWKILVPGPGSEHRAFEVRSRMIRVPPTPAAGFRTTLAVLGAASIPPGNHSRDEGDKRAQGHRAAKVLLRCVGSIRPKRAKRFGSRTHRPAKPR
jgi:hypothetical protein